MAIASLTGDIDYMLQDQGEAVTSGGVTVYGIVETPDELLLAQHGFSGQIAKIRSILLRSGALPSLFVGTSLTTYAGSYKVTDPRAEDDGQVVRVLVKEV